MRAALALLVPALAMAGCDGGPLELVSADPPAGTERTGQRADRQGGSDPDAGEDIFRLRAREGERLTYAVTVRNITDEVVLVTGVAADEDRDGAFVPEEVVGTPLRVPAGELSTVFVEGRVHGCRFGGQAVSLAGPELLLDTGGSDASQSLDLGMQVEMVVEGCG